MPTVDDARKAADHLRRWIDDVERWYAKAGIQRLLSSLDIVYWDSKNRRYHRRKTCYQQDHPREPMFRPAAEQGGATPCRRCWRPSRYGTEEKTRITEGRWRSS
jgi:hypothetical protein